MTARMAKGTQNPTGPYAYKTNNIAFIQHELHLMQVMITFKIRDYRKNVNRQEDLEELRS